MSFWTLDLCRTQIHAVSHHGKDLVIEFHGELIKTMEGASAQTHWHQRGTLRLQTPPQTITLPPLPAALRGGSLTDNIYIYRNSVRVPLNSFGNIALQLDWKDFDVSLQADGDAIDISLHDTPSYIRHADEHKHTS